MEYGTLYLVPTPIGNLADMTYRGVQTLNDVDVIYAEDTRTSGILLKHYDIKTPMKSYHKFNEKERCNEIVEYLKAGKSIAIISDAGTPGISDPSNIIIKEMIKHGLQVSSLPGATALIPALTASGFDTQQFHVVGFLPNKKQEKERLLNKLKALEIPLIFYEAPHRLEKFLNEIKEFFNNADICIAREISKLYETYYRGKLFDILDNIDQITLKGEFVVVAVPKKTEIDEKEAISRLYQDKYKDEKIANASKLIAQELALPKNMVYGILLHLG